MKALRHNGSTIAAGLHSMTRLLPQENAPDKSAAGVEKHENLKGEYTYEVA